MFSKNLTQNSKVNLEVSLEFANRAFSLLCRCLRLGPSGMEWSLGDL